MRVYEITFILKPDLTEEVVDHFVAQMETVVTSTGGTVRSVEKWGRRRLAYEVRRNREGYYVLFTVECEPPTVREFERILKVSDPAIKFLTVRIDQELKRLEKVRAEAGEEGKAQGNAQCFAAAARAGRAHGGGP